jgi:hypothetical protein
MAPGGSTTPASWSAHRESSASSAEAIAFGPPRDLPFWDGPVFGDQGPIDATLDYLRFVQDVAARCHDTGLSPAAGRQRN